jgi:hypothetical protein
MLSLQNNEWNLEIKENMPTSYMLIYSKFFSTVKLPLLSGFLELEFFEIIESKNIIY